MGSKLVNSVILFIWMFAGWRAVPAWAQHIHEQHRGVAHTHAAKPGMIFHRSEMTEFDAEAADPKVDKVTDAWQFSRRVTRVNATCLPKFVEVSVATERTERISVTVNGEACLSVDPGGLALLKALKLEAKARVGVGGGRTLENTLKVTLAEKDSAEIRPCSTVAFKVEDREIVCKGTLTAWDHKITCIDGFATTEVVSYCNKRTLSGSVTSWSESKSEWSVGDPPAKCPNCAGDDEPIDPVPVPDPISTPGTGGSMGGEPGLGGEPGAGGEPGIGGAGGSGFDV